MTTQADYKPAADLVGGWLLENAMREGEEIWWPARPGVSLEADGSLYGGIAGPALFFIEAYRTDGDERWLEPVRGTATWMARHFNETSSGWAGCGLFTGIGGWAVVLHELASATGDAEARRQAAAVVDTILAGAAKSVDGANWHEFTEIIWGTAGIGCLLLAIGRSYAGDRSMELAMQAGDWLIQQAETPPAGDFAGP